MMVAMLLVLNPLHWHLLHSWWLPALALLLDILLGDPRFPPHPVRGIGAILKFIEKPLLRIKSSKAQLFWGMQVAMLLPMFIVAIYALLRSRPGIIGIFFAVYFSYAGLALGNLLHEGKKALRLIEHGELEDARQAVGSLVSRNVSQLERGELYRPLAESLSENFCDAFVSPFLWLVLTGPPGLWAYKTISTIDSMWGYRHAPWTYLGKAGARMDDFVSFIPARLSALFLFLSAKAMRLGFSGREFKEALAQAKTMDSPNAGYSMAAAAWAHRSAMGGPTQYGEKMVDKPRLGPENAPAWNAASTGALLRHIKISGALAGLSLWGFGVAIGLLLRWIHQGSAL